MQWISESESIRRRMCEKRALIEANRDDSPMPAQAWEATAAAIRAEALARTTHKLTPQMDALARPEEVQAITRQLLEEYLDVCHWQTLPAAPQGDVAAYKSLIALFGFNALMEAGCSEKQAETVLGAAIRGYVKAAQRYGFREERVEPQMQRINGGSVPGSIIRDIRRFAQQHCGGDISL